MKFLLSLFFSFITLSSFAQQEIKIDDVKNHVGDSVKICAQVYGGKYLPNVKGMPTYLDMGGHYPDAPLRIIIWSEIRKQFDTPPEEVYDDARVCLTGIINMYKGKPQITLRSKNQIISAIKDEEIIKVK